MMKKLLFSLVIVASSITASAQSVKLQARKLPFNKAFIAPKKVSNENTTNTVYWGYPQGSLYSYGLNGTPETIGMAIRMDGKLVQGGAN